MGKRIQEISLLKEIILKLLELYFLIIKVK